MNSASLRKAMKDHPKPADYRLWGRVRIRLAQTINQ